MSGELEELVGDVDVDRLGDLHVLLVTVDHPDLGVGQVLQHDAAVVGRPELRVLVGDLVGPFQRRGEEGLRGLAAAQPRAVRDLRDGVVVVELDDRVRGRDGDVDGLVGHQRLEAVGDHVLAEQRAHGVVEEYVAVLALREGGQGELGRLVAGVGALEDLGDLRVAAVAGHRVHGVEVAGGHQDDDLVDLRVAVEHAEGVLHDRHACDLDELLRDVETHAGAHTAGKQHGNVTKH